MAGAIFLSYASQDAEAARLICEALRSGGVEVWFDQEGGLEHGDEWDAKIRLHIKECLLFIPLISANTQARHEGYFRIEWDLAAERARGIAQGVPFILPVLIDDTREPDALVPDRFRKVQWTRIPGGVVAPEVRGRLLKLWSHRAGLLAHQAANKAGAPGPAAPKPIEASARRGSGARVVAAVVIVATLAAAGWWMTRGRESPAAPAASEPPAKAPAAVAAAESAGLTAPKSVAVLAFTNLSGDKENEYFSDGISEELLNVLAKVPGLKVAARTSSFYFKGRQVPIADIAKQLGVSYVVEGNVRREGSRVRISAQLINAADGFHLWSDDFDRELKDIFAVQDEIAGLIAKNLQIKIGGALGSPRPAIDPEAFQLYLAGRAQAERAGTADIKAGIDCFQRAVAAAPGYAPAWAQLARAYIQLARWGGIETTLGYAEARKALERAVALEPDSPEVLVAEGWVRRTAEWDWKGARQAFRRALELQPNNPDTLADTAVLVFGLGQTDEGIQLAIRAVDLDPLNAQTQLNLSLLFQFAGELNKAEQACRQALHLAPEGQRYHSSLAMILAELGRPQRAEAEAALETDELGKHAAFAYIAADHGFKIKALAQVKQIEAFAHDHAGTADVYSYAAEIYAKLGEIDHAFEAEDKAVAAHDPGIAWLKSDSGLRPLHADPRWPKLLNRVGLSDEQLK
jgi:TolB-like protein/Flp pilus assembly protein TadD